MESANSLVPLYGTIYGPMYFSAVMSTAFYGVACMQTFFYYVQYGSRISNSLVSLRSDPGPSYPNDSLRMKSFVAVMWILDTIQEALTVAGVYKYIMAGLVNPLAILDQTPELVLQIITTLLISTPTQAFFVYRIYMLSGKNMIMAPVLWGIQAVYQVVAAILYVAKSVYTVDGSIRVVGYTVIDDSFSTGIATSCLAITVAVDVLIAITMTFLLFRHRNATGFASTEHILQRLTVFAVNTGIWTATVAALSLILMRVFPTSLLYMVFCNPLGSVYCNALLANLNARTYIRGGKATHNAGADMAMMSLPVSDVTKAEKQSGETKSELFFSTHQGYDTGELCVRIRVIDGIIAASRHSD
ncbi:hypothetical protein OG21DRAFT_1603108 [Imleria badia]|nr:hypothetical protein OG21DRAFT_1603108 [Imleria badia]